MTAVSDNDDNDDLEVGAVNLDPVSRLQRDVRAAASLMGDSAGRHLVDVYYQLQEYRKALRSQERSDLRALLDKHDIDYSDKAPNAVLIDLLEATGERSPVAVLTHFAEQTERLERQMVGVLDVWADGFDVGLWAKRQIGIGPVLAAGLLAHIDITRAETAGAIWRFAGLDPTMRWNKGEKRPYNARLKVLCWKVGDSFVKTSGHPNSFYGPLYRQRKEYELERDERGENAEAARRSLEERKIVDPGLRRVYESGHLPPGRLDLRARRWTVKLFLAHWHEVGYRSHFGQEPPVPYPIVHLGHAHVISCPP